MARQDDELRALRERAYGRNPDIHLDPDSLRRLHHLEAKRVEPEQPQEPEPVVHLPSAVEPEQDDVVAEPAPRPTPPVLLWLRGLRRSTVFALLGFAVAAFAIVAALTLVQRVQTDPLQVGASQVARLGVDGGYEMPGYFTSYSDGANPPQAFAAFNGIRVITSSIPYLDPDRPSACITVFAEETTTLTANSLSGVSFGGCAAGRFPAMVLVPLDTEQLPPDLVAAYPDAEALQFVYDSKNNEVVVFADAP